MRSENTIRENKRRCAHSWYANSFSFQVLDRVNSRFDARLNAQTSAMNSGEESYVQTLLDRFKEVHHQVVRNVIAAKRQSVFVSCPVAFHQFRFQSLLLEEALLVSGVNRLLTRQSDVADAD